MKKKTKLYLRLNLISLFFVAVSFISVTLAWFVYTGLSRVTTEVAVKAWYIELENEGKPVSNNVVISLDDIYPGMETLEEEIKIKNFGDSDAMIKYEISSVRILGDEAHNYVASQSLPSNFIEDKISHEYPFHINMNLSKKYVLAKTDEATFKVSISWPLDSGNDALDSFWGTEAYKFKLAEQEKKELDKNYQINSSIKLEISLTAEQYIETPEVSDPKYRLGNEILYDVSENKVCDVESATCIRTNVIDTNNTLCDSTITLLPKITQNYSLGNYNDINTIYQNYVSSWNATTRLLNISDVLHVVSRDLKDSVLVRPNVSDFIIGNVSYQDRLDKVVLSATSNQGYFKFLNKYSYFYSDNCYWLNSEYDINNSFAVQVFDQNSMKISGINKLETCKFVPVIIGNKPNFNNSLCQIAVE
jgi:hypothetical protein